MAAIHKGIQEIQLLPELDMAPNVPTTTRIRATGGRNYIIGQASAYRASGYKVTTRQDGDSPIWKLEASVEGDPNDPQGEASLENTHELRANLLSPDIRTNAVLISHFDLGVNTVNYLYGEAQSILSGDQTRTEVLDYIGNAANVEVHGVQPDEVTDATSFIDLILGGTDTFTKYQYVYVHTLNFGTLYDATIDYSNVSKRFTTEQMIFAESIPDSLNLPQTGEWLKTAPEKVVQLGGGFSLKYEYWWNELYSSLLYEVAT